MYQYISKINCISTFYLRIGVLQQVRPLTAGPVGGKDGKGTCSNNNGDVGGSDQEFDSSRSGWSSPPPPSNGVAVMRVVGK